LGRMEGPMNKNYVFPVVVLGTVLFLLATMANCTDKQCFIPEGCAKPITEPVYDHNPYTYEVGNVIAVAYVDGALVLRMQPLATFSLYTEELLLCGQPVEMFQGKVNPMVLTYTTQAHRTVRSIGCHELKRVDELKAKELLITP